MPLPCPSLARFVRPTPRTPLAAIYLNLTTRLFGPPSELPLPSTVSSENSYTYKGIDYFDFGPKDFDPSVQGVSDLEGNISFQAEFNR